MVAASCLTQDQLLMGMTADVKPIPMLSHAMAPFVSPQMVAMAPQPTIVWLPYPSPPPSPTEQANEAIDSTIKTSAERNETGKDLSKNCSSITVTSPSNTMLPVWRPW